jgi:uncharacterized protein YprB with RNaseH-like and TPR domain
MASLHEKLKALGVKTGAKELSAPEMPYPFRIESVLQGQTIRTPLGETFIVDRHFDSIYRHGKFSLEITAPMQVLANWIGNDRLGKLIPESFLFIDIETTGLSGGTGTYAFLIGAGRFEKDRFHMAQFFMRDPIEEPAQLHAFEQFIAPCQAIVSFNGKSFDIPVIRNRFTAHGWPSPFSEMLHIDLLHLARRLWSKRLPSRTLGNLEVQILGAQRSQEDVPGWMVPSLFFNYLRDGDARPLSKVFYHNEMDVLSLSVLLNIMSGLLENPQDHGNEFSVDLISLARMFEDLGDFDLATNLYKLGLNHDDVKRKEFPQDIWLQTVYRLAMIYKKLEDYKTATTLWEQAAHHQHLNAHVELAKYYEHHQKEYIKAIYWTRSAIDIVSIERNKMEKKNSLELFEKERWLSDLEHRLQRLERKSQLNQKK